MAKKSMIERENKRARLVKQYAAKRAELNEVIKDQSRPMEERFKASLKRLNCRATPRPRVCTTGAN